MLASFAEPPRPQSPALNRKERQAQAEHCSADLLHPIRGRFWGLAQHGSLVLPVYDRDRQRRSEVAFAFETAPCQVSHLRSAVTEQHSLPTELRRDGHSREEC